MINKILEIIKGLNECEEEKLNKNGFTNNCFFHENGTLTKEYLWVVIEAKKYYYLNCGGSGAFMVNNKDGEIFNIKGYGKIDKNKKLKADLGNIDSVDCKILHERRYN